MKVRNKIIKELTKEGSRNKRLRLAIALNYSEQGIDQLIKKNKENGPLTTIKALEVLRDETGLTDEEILEETEKVG